MLMHPKDAKGIANSVDPDQTALDPDQTCTVCPDLSVGKLRKNTVEGAIYTVCPDLHSWVLGLALPIKMILMHEPWQVDKDKAVFTNLEGVFEFIGMPFGPCNVPTTFERLMETVLAGLHWQIYLTWLSELCHIEWKEMLFRIWWTTWFTIFVNVLSDIN